MVRFQALTAELAEANRLDFVDTEQIVYNMTGGNRYKRVRDLMLLSAGASMRAAEVNLSPSLEEFGGTECAVRELAVVAAALGRWKVYYDMRDYLEVEND